MSSESKLFLYLEDGFTDIYLNVNSDYFIDMQNSSIRGDFYFRIENEYKKSHRLIWWYHPITLKEIEKRIEQLKFHHKFNELLDE